MTPPRTFRDFLGSEVRIRGWQWTMNWLLLATCIGLEFGENAAADALRVAAAFMP